MICSYYFYMCWNPKYAILMGISTVITYLSGILISDSNNIKDEIIRIKVKKRWVALSLFLNLGILFFFKYYDFFFYYFSRAFSIINIEINYPTFDIMLPVGISFYTFQALSYTIDVYRGDVEAEKKYREICVVCIIFSAISSRTYRKV